MSEADRAPLRIIERGEGCYLIDSEGNRLLDGLSNLFCVNVGYSYGSEFAQAAAAQYTQLGYHSSWGTTHPCAIELAERVASLAPEHLNHVFFTPSGGESVEAAWKIARQFHRLNGEVRWKAIARQMAYHGTTLGALDLTGLPELRADFEPLAGHTLHVSNTRRTPESQRLSEAEFTAGLLAELEQTISEADASTVAMVIMEPVQNHGGMLVPPEGYFKGVREICDRHGILLVADETITAFGRLGEWFGSTRVGMEPDITTTAKGLSSAHAVIGAVIVSDRVYAPFARQGRMLMHGNTFGGHPVMAAVALRNLDIMERLDLNSAVRANEGSLRQILESLRDIPVVKDVRGAGYFYAVELTTRGADGSLLSAAALADLYGTDNLGRLLEAQGLLLRISLDGGDPVLCVAPPLVAGDAEFALIGSALRSVLTVIARQMGLADVAGSVSAAAKVGRDRGLQGPVVRVTRRQS